MTTTIPTQITPQDNSYINTKFINSTRYNNLQIDGVDIFYREAGSTNSPKVLLLHGFAASSYMFRDLIPILSQKYHVVAPDLPGFGNTTVKDNVSFEYTFDKLASVIKSFLDHINFKSYAMYVFDFGAPVGWRLAVKSPKEITAIISQNGNAYEEGLSSGWDIIRKAWDNPNQENREKLKQFSSFDMIKWQYTEGTKDLSMIAPETYQLAHAAIERIGIDAQLDLFIDYGENIKQYTELHQYFRKHLPPTLVTWGKKDPFFTPDGAYAFKRDNSNAEIHLFDTGHLALETHGQEISKLILEFLDKNL